MVRKTLILTVLWLLYYFLLMFWSSLTKRAGSGSGIQEVTYGSDPVPNCHVSETMLSSFPSYFSSQSSEKSRLPVRGGEMLLYQGLENTLGCGDEVCQLLLALKEARPFRVTNKTNNEVEWTKGEQMTQNFSLHIFVWFVHCIRPWEKILLVLSIYLKATKPTSSYRIYFKKLSGKKSDPE